MTSTTRVLLKLGGLFLILAIVVVLAAMLSALVSQRQLEEYKHSLVQRGEKLDVLSLAPKLQPGEDRDAEHLLELCRAVQSVRKEQKIPTFTDSFSRIPDESGECTVEHEQASVRATEPGESKELVMDWETALARSGALMPLFPQLCAAAKAPVLTVQPDYTRGVRTRISGSEEIMNASACLTQIALLFLHEGDLDSAADAIAVQLKLAGLLQGQPMLISQLLAAGIVRLAQSMTWELLQNPAVSGPQLIKLQRAWESVNIMESAVPTLRMERATGLACFSLPPQQIFQLLNDPMATTPSSGFPKTWPEFKDLAFFGVWSVFLRAADEHRLINYYQTVIDSCPEANPQSSWANTVGTATRLEKEEKESNSFLLLSPLLIPAASGFLSSQIRTQAMADLTVLAIAVQRYRLDHGMLPDSAQGLTPGYLASVPPDPFDGKPLRYRRLDSQNFLLYSVGPDGIDQGGDSAKIPQKRSLWDRKDLVWPKAKKAPQPMPDQKTTS